MGLVEIFNCWAAEWGRCREYSGCRNSCTVQFLLFCLLMRLRKISQYIFITWFNSIYIYIKRWLAGFKSMANALLLAQVARSLFVICVLNFISPLSSVGWYCEAGVFGLIGCQSLSPGHCIATLFTTTNINII